MFDSRKIRVHDKHNEFSPHYNLKKFGNKASDAFRMGQMTEMSVMFLFYFNVTNTFRIFLKGFYVLYLILDTFDI
jgi:hypothetical protein